MTRGHGWRFTDMGRRIERVAHTATLIRSTLAEVPAPEDADAVLEALLEVADTSITYRRRYLGALETAPVLDLLLTDETNPRSVVFQLVVLDDHVRQLPRSPTRLRSAEERLTTAVLTRVRLADIALLCRADAEGRRTHLDALLAQLGEDMRALSNLVTRQYLSHTRAPRQLGGI